MEKKIMEILLKGQIAERVIGIVNIFMMIRYVIP